MTRKKLVSFIEFLKLTDTGKDVTIHNRKKSHTEVAEQLGLSFRYHHQVPRLSSVHSFGTCSVIA